MTGKVADLHRRIDTLIDEGLAHGAAHPAISPAWSAPASMNGKARGRHKHIVHGGQSSQVATATAYALTDRRRFSALGVT